MESERFFQFTRMVDGIHKNILKLRLDNASAFGVKGVHIFWVYELLKHPEGMSATELAANSRIDRSLISREISALKKQGYIKAEETTGKRSYNTKLTLTESGKEAAERIGALGLEIQNRVSGEISEEELAVFYSALAKIYDNLEKLADARG